MSFRPLGLSAVLLTILALATAPRLAAAAPDDTQKEAARNLMWSGDQLFQNGDHGRALQAYLAADAIMNVPTTGLAVARAHAALGQLVEARDKAQLVARSTPQAKESPILTEARTAAAKLATDVAARIPTLIVKVSGPPASATEVTIDGVKVASSELASGWKLNPGNHTVVTAADGFEGAEQRVTLIEGQSETLQIAMQPASAPASGPSTGTLLMATGFSVGGVALIVGAVTGGLSIAETDALLDRCGGPRCDPGAADDLSSATTLANVSNGAFVVGGVGIVVGIIGVVLEVTEPAAAEAAFMPKVSGRGVSWSFH
ncbi:MAG: hypothetical protein HOV80_06490 [Polyangiaceae bacterium]|nr:hypothetical protein [Polyangiaceae bacterium]